ALHCLNQRPRGKQKKIALVHVIQRGRSLRIVGQRLQLQQLFRILERERIQQVMQIRVLDLLNRQVGSRRDDHKIVVFVIAGLDLVVWGEQLDVDLETAAQVP